MLIKLLPALLLLLLMTACSNNPVVSNKTTEPVSEILWSERQQELKSIQAWEINGRLGVKTSEDAWSATLKWQHNDDLSRLRIIAPFHGTYEIRQEDKQYSLMTPDDGMLVTENPEQVMLENVGWTIPVRSLMYWVRGLVDESLNVELKQVNEKAQLVGLQQKNWLIKFSNYMAVKQYSLPGKIVLSNQYATITLLNKNWKLSQ